MVHYLIDQIENAVTHMHVDRQESVNCPSSIACCASLWCPPRVWPTVSGGRPLQAPVQLDDCKLTERCGAALEDMLLNARTLSLLSLGWNNLGPRGAAALATGVESNISLATLLVRRPPLAPPADLSALRPSRLALMDPAVLLRPCSRRRAAAVEAAVAAADACEGRKGE